MKKVSWLGGALAVAGVAALVVSVSTVYAATVKFTFTARGIITGVDLVNKTIEVDVTKAVPNKAKDTMEGENIEFKVGTTKVVKVMNGKDKPVTYKNLVIGQEVGMKGTAYEDDTYSLSFARIHDRSFSVIGTIEGHDETNRTVKIQVISSSYKPTVYKAGTEITMKYFDGNSTFYSKTTKTPIEFSEVDIDHQRAKVTGTITSNSTWEVKTLIEEYAGS